jgi:hypothetical protein
MVLIAFDQEGWAASIQNLIDVHAFGSTENEGSTIKWITNTIFCLIETANQVRNSGNLDEAAIRSAASTGQVCTVASSVFLLTISCFH